MSEFNSTKALMVGITALLAIAAGTATYLGTFKKAEPAQELRKLDELVTAGVREAEAARQAAHHAGELAASKAVELRRSSRAAAMHADSGHGTAAAVAGHGAQGSPDPKPAAVVPATTSAPPSATTADLSKLPPATGAPHVRGIVAIGGTRPSERAIGALAADANCGKQAPGPVLTRIWVGKGQGLANTFVYIKKGLEGKTFPVPNGKPVVDQKICVYEPLITGSMVGQTVEIRNSDPFMHNVFMQKPGGGLASFNTSQNAGAQPILKTFTNPEMMIRFVCSVHPWMAGYVCIIPHPFFAVTDENGVFELPAGLPAGNYTLAAQHLKGGEVTAEITVGADGAAAVGLVIPVK